MAIEFDISKDPPSLAEINAEREQAEIARALLWKKDIRYMVTAMIILVLLITFHLTVAVPAVRDPGVERPDLIAAMAYFTPYVIFFWFATSVTLHNKIIEKPRKSILAIVDALEEVTAADVLEALGDDHDLPEIVAYQQKVSAQRRPLMQGEIDAMKQWLNLRSKAQKQVKTSA